jgi:D-alanine-D-alanine ligase
MTKIRVGVLRGGPSNEYDVSLATGANVLSALRDKLAEKYTAIDVLVDKSGKWHVDGIELKPENAIKRFDVAFLAFHGAYGEDGKVQKFLEDNKMPFTGSGSLGSAIGMNKILSKKVFRDHGIKTPVDMAISSKDIISDSNSVAQKVFKSFSFPIVVKPATSGSSVGISIVKEFPDLEKALIEASRHSDDVLLEEYIKGKESTVGVIENFRGEKIYALPPVEIRPKTGFFDFQAKYQGKSEEIVPAPFDKELTRQLCDLAKKVHEVMGLKQYSRTDFIIHERRGVYVLEVNTLPGLTNESLIPKSLRAVGSDTHELVDHLISSLVQ